MPTSKVRPSRERQPAFLDQVAGEIRQVDFGLKADQVVVTQRGQKPLVAGQRGEDFRRRQRRVQEQAELVDEAAFPQRAWPAATDDNRAPR